jgi:DNA-binding transcriptional ArsR family regulator
MSARENDQAVSRIAAAIGEPARARMLYALMDGRARTGIELATLAEVTPSTASVHLKRLTGERLVRVLVQGKHRFYSLEGPHVARVLEGLSVLAGGEHAKFEPSTPNELRLARTCYDHIAGTVGVALHDRLMALRWLSADGNGKGYAVTPAGVVALRDLDIDVDGVRALRRRFAGACLDWSERRPHLGGALAAALLDAALKRKWVVRHLDSRALEVTAAGRREMRKRFGVEL